MLLHVCSAVIACFLSSIFCCFQHFFFNNAAQSNVYTAPVKCVCDIAAFKFCGMLSSLNTFFLHSIFTLRSVVEHRWAAASGFCLSLSHRNTRFQGCLRSTAADSTVSACFMGWFMSPIYQAHLFGVGGGGGGVLPVHHSFCGPGFGCFWLAVGGAASTRVTSQRAFPRQLRIQVSGAQRTSSPTLTQTRALKAASM